MKCKNEKAHWDLNVVPLINFICNKYKKAKKEWMGGDNGVTAYVRK